MTVIPPPPREPEIELLGLVARRFLWLVRRVLWLAGFVAVGFGLWRSGADSGWDFAEPGSLTTLPAATGVVWLCAGLPALARVDWLFGRGWRIALPVAAGLWFGACLLPAEREFGWILRAFASLVPCLTLLVWRTLWRLTLPGSKALAAASVPASTKESPRAGP